MADKAKTQSAKGNTNPTKAGRRKFPASPGPHITTAYERERGRWLSSLGLKNFKRPPALVDFENKLVTRVDLDTDRPIGH